MYLALSGTLLAAETALSWGLVDDVTFVPDGTTAASG
jgi:enoyl-CoA hydratase/carnithine racemase